MNNLTTHSFWRAIFIVVASIFLIAGHTVLARDIRVEGGCGLRDAIRAANYNNEIDDCDAGAAGGDTIILTRDMNQKRTLPEITSNITLDGRGHTITLRDRPAFIVDEGQLTLKNIHIRFEEETDDDVLEISDGALTLESAFFDDCEGDIDADDSTIQLYRNYGVCHHSREIIYMWFDYVPPRPPTCTQLTDASIRAAQGLKSGVQCQDVNAAGVGNQTVYDAGFIDAVDVWGDLGSGVELCFPQIGALMFLDAATAPRALSSIESYGEAGYTCATLHRAGTVVLVRGQHSSAASAAVVAAPEPAPEVSEPMVDGCPIRTTGHINFRAAPSLDAEKLGYVFRGSTVGAISRIRGWYQIIHLGRTGWIGGKYVDNIGNC